MENVTISKQEYLQLLRCKQIVGTIEAEIHEPEFKEEFVKKTEDIRSEMNRGKKIRFRSVEEMEKYLEKNQ
ncbi:hypothetical protein HZC08_00200 [Candidatus Micrarchaeota archaeon]|nr:hypothetical protein [Candidatus Micrarchaeota archaeon]